MKIVLSIIGFVLLLTHSCTGQNDSYADSLLAWRQRYINGHEVVKDNDRLNLHFFPVDKKYCIPARFEKIHEAPWFSMETSGKIKKLFRVYGILHFTINDTAQKLHIYQPQRQWQESSYDGYLFIPFTDKTTGEETYETGRYIDLFINDLEAPVIFLDFNKAYNPYCAYISNKYNCPLPPKENDLPVAIKAGEIKFGKSSTD